ncbi:MAG: LD-carboxypeptidase [Bacteroidetes bacterium]|nr:LD-carboxypeptidase [Bacteroidota bacterium]
MKNELKILPKYLNKGDTVLIIATARARNKEAIEPSITILKQWGLKVELGENLFKTHHQFAGTDLERANDLQWAINHKTAKAVIVAGGGYGTIRIIDLVDFKALKKYPKWFVGYSDVTALHARLLHYNFACIHGVLAFQFSKNKFASNSLKNCLFNTSIKYNIPVSSLNISGACKGEVVGGNLSLIYALSGSKDDLETKHKILFIEDIDEQLYHIDRMMLQLKRSGKLKNLKGLIVGGMSDMKDNAIPFGKTAQEIILESVKEYNYPVCFNFPAGHIDKNLAIILGKKATLKVTKTSVDFFY